MLVLKNGTAVELVPATVAGGVDIVINDTTIEAVGPNVAEDHPGAPSIDLNGKVVTPGLVCGHNHFYSGLARGILADIQPSPDFVSNLANLWWRLDRALDADSLRLSGLVCATEALKAGCTSVIDHHASPSCISGSLEILKDCFEQVGLRGIECYETTDRNGVEDMEQGVEENRRFAELVDKEKVQKGPGRLVESMIGGHAPFTLPDEALAKLADVVEATGRGFHVHVAEDRFDAAFAHRYHRKDLLRRLDDFGLLTSGSLIAHGIYLGPEEIELLNRRGAFLAHNCRSNMNNGVGYNDGLSSFDRVVVGTDGIGADMFQELRFAYFKHRDARGSLAPSDFVGFLHGGNEILRRYFDEEFGRLAPGCKADLTILDYDPPTPLVAENLHGHMMFGMSAGDVDTVIVNGRVRMQNREFSFETRELYREARGAAEKLWQRMDRL